MPPPKLDFLLVGAAKSGTTSLHRYLARHRQLFLPDAKEMALFLDGEDDPLQRGLFEELYTGARPHHRVGLSHANMLMFRRVPDRVRRHNPAMRILAILRDPVERAYSSYWAAHLRGFEPAATFEEAIERELDGELRTDKERIDWGHLEPGYYAAHLERFRSALGPDQVFALLSEDLAGRPEATLCRLLGWLGVEESVSGMDLRRRHNRTLAVKSDIVEAFLSTGARPLRLLVRAVVPLRARIWLHTRIVQRLRLWNRRPAPRPPMQPETRARLIGLYRDDRDRLENLLERDLSSWLTGQRSAASLP